MTDPSFVKRRVDRNIKLDREEYLARNAPGTITEPKACHPMMDANPQGGGAPWLTVILGSDLRHQISGDSLAQRLEERLQKDLPGKFGDLGFDPNDESERLPLRDVVISFCRNLVRDRCGEGSGDEPGELGKFTKTDLQILALTAWANWAYQSAMAKAHRPVSKAHSRRDLPVDLPEGLSLDMNSGVGRLVEALAGGKPPISLGPILDDIRDGKLILRHLNALNSISWGLIADRLSRSYPRWDDLEALVAAQTRGDGVKELGQAADWIRGRFENPTKESMARGLEQPTVPTLHSKLAQVLNEQATFSRENPKLGCPVPSAFILTFDLEAELALIREEGKPFRIGLPVYFVVENPKRQLKLALLTWMACSVDPEAFINQYGKARIEGRKELVWKGLTEELTEWHPLKSEVMARQARRAAEGQTTAADENERAVDQDERATAVLLHPNGCPLLALPQLDTEGGGLTPLGVELVTKFMRQLSDSSIGAMDPAAFSAKGDSGSGEDASLCTLVEGFSVHLRHALVLGDYDAIHETVAEIESSDSIGYPHEYSKGTRYRPRYWMGLGINLSDPALRHRIASGFDRMGAPLSGIVVSREHSDTERDLLAWLGLRPVDGNPEEFMDDLEVYRRHIDTESPFPPPGQACQLCEKT